MIIFFIMSSRKYPSGCQKRQKRKYLEQETKKMTGSLFQYFPATSVSDPSSYSEAECSDIVSVHQEVILNDVEDSNMHISEGTYKNTYSIQRNERISRKLDSNPNTECKFSPRDSFKVSCYNVICDELIVYLNKRMEAYSILEEKFGFLCNSNLPQSEVITTTARFKDFYSADIEDSFSDEFVHFSPIFKLYNSPKECLKKIRNSNLSHTFPNVEIALRIFLTLPVSNCLSEKSFSVLKRIKNRLRNSMTQENLQAFSILSIENDITSRFDFNDIIDDFALLKSRKRLFKKK